MRNIIIFLFDFQLIRGEMKHTDCVFLYVETELREMTCVTEIECNATEALNRRRYCFMFLRDEVFVEYGRSSVWMEVVYDIKVLIVREKKQEQK